MTIIAKVNDRFMSEGGAPPRLTIIVQQQPFKGLLDEDEVQIGQTGGNCTESWTKLREGVKGSLTGGLGHAV